MNSNGKKPKYIDQICDEKVCVEQVSKCHYDAFYLDPIYVLAGLALLPLLSLWAGWLTLLVVFSMLDFNF